MQTKWIEKLKLTSRDLSRGERKTKTNERPNPVQIHPPLSCSLTIQCSVRLFVQSDSALCQSTSAQQGPSVPAFSTLSSEPRRRALCAEQTDKRALVGPALGSAHSSAHMSRPVERESPQRARRPQRERVSLTSCRSNALAFNSKASRNVVLCSLAVISRSRM
ncbi:hypothetical protein Ddc_16450 [Ditylenchus destructor]|nr:hypothetical protein Ddc_16450 [Ditylenchus destructor]